MPPMLLTALPHSDHDVAAHRVRPVTPTRSLTDGDLLDLGDHALEVLHLPGHSPGSIALLDKDTNTASARNACTNS